MPNPSQRPLSPSDAARLIYGVSSPSVEQVDKVRHKLARGVLRRCERGPWMTTPEFVAEYLSRGADQRERTGAGADKKRLGRVYRELLLDYCLAVLKRRKASRQSRAFQRAVAIGQVACLLLLVAAAVQTVRYGFDRSGPERVAVENWIGAHEGRFAILKWYPLESADGGCKRLRVEYKYAASRRKSVTTDRTFTLREGQVTDVVQTD